MRKCDTSRRCAWRKGPGSSRGWVLALIFMGVCIPALGIADQPTANELRAAFLYAFFQFIEWPPDALDTDGVFSLCVLESPDLGAAVEQFTVGKSVRNRRLAVRQLEQSDGIHGCHVLFMGEPTQERVAAILDSVEGQPILTIGEQDGFAHRGGMINFTWEANRLRFEINRGAAERNRLRIGSKILSRARLVDEASPSQ